MVAAIVLLGEHMLEVEVSRRGLGGSSSWGYRCCHMELLLVAYFDPLCLPALASKSLTEGAIGQCSSRQGQKIADFDRFFVEKSDFGGAGKDFGIEKSGVKKSEKNRRFF